MGYPMTFRRVLNRNNLQVGGYGHNPATDPMPLTWYAGVNLVKSNSDNMIARIKRYEQQIRLLLGDLRRLEDDTKDERATCKAIANQTGVDEDTVAIVLKAYIDF